MDKLLVLVGNYCQFDVCYKSQQPKILICVIGAHAMPKRTHQPKKRKRSREHGFMKRMATTAGRAVIKRRRNKGRAKLTA